MASATAHSGANAPFAPAGVLAGSRDAAARALPRGLGDPELFDATGFLDGAGLGGRRSRLLNPYYRVKPLIPRSAQLAMRRLYARRQARRRFPAWPIETLRVDQMKDRLRAEMRERGTSCVPFVNFWPDRHRFAMVLTHDVEGPAGVENIPRVLAVERRHGMRSSWNFVAEDYEIPAEATAAVLEAGGEIGLHGLHHDGLLFASRESFLAQLPRIGDVMREWDAVGFRSPATHRERAWMPDLGCLYDSSFPDTDPFEPQPDGCCAIWPFFMDELVELPITMPQDHTLWEILQDRSIELWATKSSWLAASHGLVNVLVHPDYVLDDESLGLYDELLGHLASLPGQWHALPRDVADWWRVRAGRAPGVQESSFEPAVDAANATVAYARTEGEDIVFDI